MRHHLSLVWYCYRQCTPRSCPQFPLGVNVCSPDLYCKLPSPRPPQRLLTSGLPSPWMVSSISCFFEWPLPMLQKWLSSPGESRHLSCSSCPTTDGTTNSEGKGELKKNCRAKVPTRCCQMNMPSENSKSVMCTASCKTNLNRYQGNFTELSVLFHFYVSYCFSLKHSPHFFLKKCPIYD